MRHRHPDHRRLIIDALSRLSPGQRAVILRSFYLKWTTTEIAADLNIADSIVKSRLRDALQALAQSVSQANETSVVEYPKCSARL
jgi:RNA polymerase sigma-70 factor (ECF subfamily)